MSNHIKYKVNNTDNFQAGDFPKVINELDVLNEIISESPDAYKKEILVSFLKKQTLEDDWISINPALTTLICSGVFQTDHLEALFNSCRQNKEFRHQYEDYISERIS